jgi:hypothetical protein
MGSFRLVSILPSNEVIVNSRIIQILPCLLPETNQAIHQVQ